MNDVTTIRFMTRQDELLATFFLPPPRQANGARKALGIVEMKLLARFMLAASIFINWFAAAYKPISHLFMGRPALMKKSLSRALLRSLSGLLSLSCGSLRTLAEEKVRRAVFES